MQVRDTINCIIKVNAAKLNHRKLKAVCLSYLLDINMPTKLILNRSTKKEEKSAFPSKFIAFLYKNFQVIYLLHFIFNALTPF